MEAVFRPEIVRIFPVNSCQVPLRSDRNRPEIIGKISGRNTASMFQGVPVFFGRNRPVLIDLGYDWLCLRMLFETSRIEQNSTVVAFFYRTPCCTEFYIKEKTCQRSSFDAKMGNSHISYKVEYNTSR